MAATATATQSRRQLHFMVFPMLAPGHMNPMIDAARILARCDGVIVTILTTPVNANRFRSKLDEERQRGSDIRVHELRLPCVEFGLPEGCENADLVPKGKNLETALMMAIGMLRPQVEEAIKRSDPPASCIVSDMLVTWTADIARELNIPRIVSNGSCCFAYYCSTKITEAKILSRVSSETEMFSIPDMPHRNIQVSKAQVKGCTLDPSVLVNDGLKQLAEKLIETVGSSYGVIVNSFDELEPEYVELYKKNFHQGRVWCIGPASLWNEQYRVFKHGEEQEKEEEEYCLKWLGMQAPGSAIYVSLGSLARVAAEQMVELAMGLESSERPFVWALGKPDEQLDSFEAWMAENGFEERNRGRGVLVRGWAPQLLILSHPSTGAFLTHCGWNSTLEAISAGVPLLTWPLFAEQFLNEKLAVEVLGIGVSLGVKVSAYWNGKEMADGGVVVKKEEIKEGIGKLIGGDGREGKKVRQLGEKAKKAIQKGGSSHLNLISLIESIASFGTANP